MIAHLTWAGDGVAYFGTNSGIAIEALTRLHLPSFPKYADFTSSELHKEACEKWAKQRLEGKGISFSFVGGLPTAVNQAALEILPKESTRDRKTNPNFVYAFVLFGLMSTLLFVYVQKYPKNPPLKNHQKTQ